MIFSTILIDDEPAARRVLRTMLQPYDWINIKAEAGNGQEAIILINALKPDLIFLDIHLPDKSGFEVLDNIFHLPNVIFTTAYEQYAIKAFETFSIDYLLKPIHEQRLDQSLQKLRQFGKAVTDPSGLKKFFDVLNAEKKPTAFPVRTGDKIVLVKFDQISFFEADDKYVNLYTNDGKKYLVDDTMTQLTEKLPSQFLRVQKSFIINTTGVKELYRHFNKRFVIILNDVRQTRITTGQTFHEAVRAAFNL